MVWRTACLLGHYEPWDLRRRCLCSFTFLLSVSTSSLMPTWTDTSLTRISTRTRSSWYISPGKDCSVSRLRRSKSCMRWCRYPELPSRVSVPWWRVLVTLLRPVFSPSKWAAGTTLSIPGEATGQRDRVSCEASAPSQFGNPVLLDLDHSDAD